MDISKRTCLAKSLDSQIANLRNDGIVFDMCNEESAKAYLSANTYLFRLSDMLLISTSTMTGSRRILISLYSEGSEIYSRRNNQTSHR